MLSGSLSPAPGPCGIPEELCPPDGAAPPDELDGAGAGLGLDVVVVLDWVVVERAPLALPPLAELEELEPQAAAVRAATTRTAGASLRILVIMVALT